LEIPCTYCNETVRQGKVAWLRRRKSAGYVLQGSCSRLHSGQRRPQPGWCGVREQGRRTYGKSNLGTIS
jgi:hypothetical protein